MRTLLPPWKPVALAAATLVVFFLGSTAIHLRVLPTSGGLAVGRDRIILVDHDRLEAHTVDPRDNRSVPLRLWYPAKPGTGEQGGYIADYEAVADGLVESGALTGIEAVGLRWVRTAALDGADVEGRALPVIILSPGNQTNVAFYASLAEELASRGYLVIGVDHAFQVAATVISDGSVATYDATMDIGEPATSIAAKVDERVADIAFLLGALRGTVPELERFRGVADLERVGLLGHSNGGLTAFEVCRVDSSISACLNMDGQAAGGPLGHRVGAEAPHAPFLFLTKETQLHPVIGDRFEQATAPGVRVVVPDAAHDSFTDGPLFQPGLNPLTTGAERVMTSVRSVTVAFFENWLKQPRDRPYDGLVSPADVYINVYPLGSLQPIPQA